MAYSTTETIVDGKKVWAIIQHGCTKPGGHTCVFHTPDVCKVSINSGPDCGAHFIRGKLRPVIFLEGDEGRIAALTQRLKS